MKNKTPHYITAVKRWHITSIAILAIGLCGLSVTASAHMLSPKHSQTRHIKPKRHAHSTITNHIAHSAALPRKQCLGYMRRVTSATAFGTTAMHRMIAHASRGNHHTTRLISKALDSQASRLSHATKTRLMTCLASAPKITISNHHKGRKQFEGVYLLHHEIRLKKHFAPQTLIHEMEHCAQSVMASTNANSQIKAHPIAYLPGSNVLAAQSSFNAASNAFFTRLHHTANAIRSDKIDHQAHTMLKHFEYMYPSSQNIRFFNIAITNLSLIQTDDPIFTKQLGYNTLKQKKTFHHPDTVQRINHRLFGSQLNDQHYHLRAINPATNQLLIEPLTTKARFMQLYHTFFFMINEMYSHQNMAKKFNVANQSSIGQARDAEIYASIIERYGHRTFLHHYAPELMDITKKTQQRFSHLLCHNQTLDADHDNTATLKGYQNRPAKKSNQG